MKLQGDFLFDAPLEQVWQALLDPEVLAATMPGCEKLDRVDGQYRGELNVKVGPIQGKFSGKVDLRDMNPPHGYTMVVDGQGAPGFVKASAVVKLEPEGQGTRMRYDADAQVGGKIASVGQRLLEASARAITKQSLEGLHENIKIRAAAAKSASAAHDAPAGAADGSTEAQPAAATSAVETGRDPTFGGPSASRRAESGAPSPSEASAEESVIAVHGGPGIAPAGAEPVGPPAIALKRVSQTALAASIAKEVTKSLLPTPVLVGIGVTAIVVIAGWFLLHH